MPAAAKSTATPPRRAESAPAFSESPAWQGVGDGWRQLHGGYREVGFSFEWHDFKTAAAVDWARSFHPGSIELCLNLDGRGVISERTRELRLEPLTAGFYRQDAGRLTAARAAGDRHQFLTVELAPRFLQTHLGGQEDILHEMVREAVRGGSAVALSEPVRLGADHLQIINSLRHPPVFASAQRVWYQAKALELIAAFFFRPPPEQELFCQRQQRLGQDRVERVVALLKANLAEPPSLEALGKQVGCSPFYLSRIFSQQMGRTISQHLRQLRMERAAELLRAGKLNVTQVAMEVGYSSSSHFSTAFHETFGCCPGLYPLPVPKPRR